MNAVLDLQGIAVEGRLQAMEIVDPGDWSLVKADNDVAFAQTSFSARTIVFKRDDENPAFNRQVVKANDTSRQRHILSRESDITPTHSTVANQPAGDKLRRIDRSGEADALCRKKRRPARRRHHCRL